MNNVFVGLKELVETMHEDFRKKINAAAPKNFPRNIYSENGEFEDRNDY